MVNLKHFLQEECAWRLVRRSLKHRELYTVCCRSGYFNPVPEGDGSGYIHCQALLLQRERDHVILLAINGVPFGHFSCSRLRRHKHVVPGVCTYYTLTCESSLDAVNLGFSPTYTPPTACAGARGLGPETLYEHCEIVGPEEAEGITTKGPNAAQRLGGACAWAVPGPAGLVIYAYVLTFDLYTACCDRGRFPSMARVFADLVYCGDAGCALCRDHGKHVDATAKFIGCVPDTGNCFCYAPCSTASRVHDDSQLPFVTDDEAATSIQLNTGVSSLGTDVSAHVSVKDADGRALAVKSAAWHLVRFPPGLSRLIVLACPVLKRLACSPRRR